MLDYPTDQSVTPERVSYKARALGTQIIGNLYLPCSHEAGKGLPAIILVHPFGGVKEQTAGLYALRLAERGFVTLAYDAAYQGESEGLPRQLEVPSQRVDDISCAIDFLSTRPEVDPNRIGVLGICSGGAYAIASAPTEMRLRAVASVSLFDLGDARRNAMGALSPSERRARLSAAAAQRSLEAAGAAPMLVPVVPDSADGFTDATPPMYREGQAYYRTARGYHPNSTNRYPFSCLPQQMAFFPFAQIEEIAPRPLLCIIGAQAETGFWSRQAIEHAQEPRALEVIEGASHVDLYDRPEFVGQALDRLERFFGESLA